MGIVITRFTEIHLQACIWLLILGDTLIIIFLGNYNKSDKTDNLYKMYISNRRFQVTVEKINTHFNLCKKAPTCVTLSWMESKRNFVLKAFRLVNKNLNSGLILKP